MVTSSKTCRKGLKVDSPAKQAKSQRVKHLGIVNRDGYLAPFEDAIRGRHEHTQWKYSQYTDNGKSTYQTLLMDMNITDCINLKKAGCSANGLPMLLTFI